VGVGPGVRDNLIFFFSIASKSDGHFRQKLIAPQNPNLRNRHYELWQSRAILKHEPGFDAKKIVCIGVTDLAHVSYLSSTIDSQYVVCVVVVAVGLEELLLDRRHEAEK
jgi:hypothetical protein